MDYLTAIVIDAISKKNPFRKMRDKKRWVYCPQRIWHVTITQVDGEGGNT